MVEYSRNFIIWRCIRMGIGESNGFLMHLDIFVGIGCHSIRFPHIYSGSLGSVLFECKHRDEDMAHGCKDHSNDPWNEICPLSQLAISWMDEVSTYLEGVRAFFERCISKLWFAAVRTGASAVINSTSVVCLIQVTGAHHRQSIYI